MAKKDVSEQMDKLLGKPPVPTYLSKAELSAKEDELVNTRVKLQQKETELSEKEGSLKKELRDLQNTVYELKRARAQLWEDIDKLQRQKEFAAHEVAETKEDIEELKEELRSKQTAIKDAQEIGRLLDKKRAQIAELEEREQKLVLVERQLKEKEVTMNRLSQLIARETEIFEKRKRSQINEIDDLEKQKILLLAQVKEIDSELSVEQKRLKQALGDVKELYKAAEQKNKFIDVRAQNVEKELEKKRTFLDEREMKLNKYALTLDKNELDIREWESELHKEHERLGSEKKEEDEIRNKIIELTTEERMIEQRIADKNTKITELERDYSSKSEELKRDQSLLEEKEQEIVDKVKQLEDDEHILAKKEDEFIEQIHELEKDKLLFDSKVREFSDRLARTKEIDKEISAFNKEVAEKTLELNKREEVIYDREQKMKIAAEFKESIKVLKEQKATMEKQLKVLQVKSSKAEEINKKITEREKKVQDRERMLSEKDTQIKQLFSDFLTQKSDLEGKDIRAYYEQLGPSEVEAEETQLEVASEMVAEGKPSNYQLLSLIANARNALNASDYAQAHEIYAKLNTLYKKLPANVEKKKLYYEILELKTDIELKMI